MFGILEAAPAYNTTIHDSLDELLRVLHERVEKDGYKVVKSRSHRARIGGAEEPGNEVIRCDLVCSRGGRPYKCMATKHKTSTRKTGCPWKAKAVHRKTLGGWVLTLICDQHNHEPGTPEPPTPTAASEAGDDEAVEGTSEHDGPRPDSDTAAALQVAGVSEAVLRLTGDTFHQFKAEYRKMAQHERLGILSQLQLRIAAIYAVQNEDVQRQRRQEAMEKQHKDVDNRRQSRHSGGLHSRSRQRRPVSAQGASVANGQQMEQYQQQQQQQHPQASQQQLPHQQHQPLPQQPLPQQHTQQHPQQRRQQQQQQQQQQHSQPPSQSQTPQPGDQRQQHQQPRQHAPSTEFIFPVPGFDMPEHSPDPQAQRRGRAQMSATPNGESTNRAYQHVQ